MWQGSCKQPLAKIWIANHMLMKRPHGYHLAITTPPCSGDCLWIKAEFIKATRYIDANLITDLISRSNLPPTDGLYPIKQIHLLCSLLIISVCFAKTRLSTQWKLTYTFVNSDTKDLVISTKSFYLILLLGLIWLPRTGIHPQRYIKLQSSVWSPW